MNDEKVLSGMIDSETGKLVSREEILKESLDMLSNVCCFLYELEDKEGIAFAFMADTALRYGQAIYYEKDPRRSEEDYLLDEDMLERRKRKSL